MLALQADPAMANDCDFRERGNRDDVVVCHDDGDHDVYKVDALYDEYSNYGFSNPTHYYGAFDYYSYGCEGPVCLID